MMTTQPTRKVRRGRIFPEIQWSVEKQALWQVEAKDFYQRCQVVFARLKPELINTHYNWYMAVEPKSGDYFLHQDEEIVAKMAHQKYPKTELYIFRINETGACGTL